MENDRKKISIWHFVLGIHGGGVENVIYNYFSHMDLNSFDLHIVVHMEIDEKKALKFRELGFKIHKMTMVHGHRIRIRNLIEYSKLFKNNKIDIVHNHFPNNLLPIIFAKIYGVKGRILHSHMDYKAAFVGKSGLKKFLYNFGFKINVKNATDLFACGKKAGESCYGDSSFMIINNAIELEKYKYDKLLRVQTRNELTLKDDEILIGNTGRFEDKQKNQKFLVKLFSEFHKVYEKSKLIFIGDGPLKKDIIDFCYQLGLEESVVFVGYVNNIEKYYNAMDIFVFPSIFEGFSVATIEAQCNGLPGIISDKVASEMNITGLFKQLSLDSETDIWVNTIKELIKVKRQDRTSEMKMKGYDISTEAKKLSDYYLLIGCV